MLALLGAIGVAYLSRGRPSSRDSADGNIAAPAIAADADRYQPAVAEGLGIALDIVLDNSGSMGDTVRGDVRSKGDAARRAILAMLDATDHAAATHPDVPVKIALHSFATTVTEVLPMQPYNRATVRRALNSIPEPHGGTAIGSALDEARAALYRSGMFRKNILVVTDGRNTNGPSPAHVAREIFSRSGGEVHIYFVAFDIDAKRFAFLHSVRGTVVPAANAEGLRIALDSLYQGHVLAESVPATTPLPAPRP